MKAIKICVPPSRFNIERLSLVDIHADTAWAVFQLVEWISSAMEDGERPAEKCFTQRLGQVEEVLIGLGLEYYRILRDEHFERINRDYK